MRSTLARRTVLLLGLASLVALTPAPADGAAEAPRLRVDFIDVGQGDAALVTSPTGRPAPPDGGPHAASPAIVTFRRAHVRGPLALVILTHRHADHFGGLRAVV